MRLLQFSTSHYCRKARLILGYKGIPYEVENLTPGFHWWRVKSLTGGQTVPVLWVAGEAIGDSTEIGRYLETHYPQPSLTLGDRHQQQEAEFLEDWLDESLGTATRFVYYHYRSREGKSINPSWLSQTVIQTVKIQYNINHYTVKLAAQRLQLGLQILGDRWENQPYLVGNQPSIADLTAAALLSPLALVPPYPSQYPRLWQRIKQIHHLCGEPLPPGLSTDD